MIINSCSSSKTYSLLQKTLISLSTSSIYFLALDHAYICLCIAMFFIVVALILVVLKAFKFPFKFLVASVICCSIACKFNFCSHSNFFLPVEFPKNCFDHFMNIYFSILESVYKKLFCHILCNKLLFIYVSCTREK